MLVSSGMPAAKPAETIFITTGPGAAPHEGMDASMSCDLSQYFSWQVHARGRKGIRRERKLTGLIVASHSSSDRGRLESLLLGGWKAEVWLQPGKEATQVLRPTASAYASKPKQEAVSADSESDCPLDC